VPSARETSDATTTRFAWQRHETFGKWHLGYEPKFNPMEHGWDAFFGYMGGNVHYFNHRETSDLHVLFKGRLPVHREGYMTELITDDSIEFIQQNRNRPFFLYVSHECPHFPFQGPGDGAKLVTAENWMDIAPDAYVAMLENLDAEVGRLLAAINDAGIAENTVVVFVSDNGGFAGAAHMGGLREAKGTTFEGGIRVPLIIRWPGQIKPGRTCHQTCITFDLTRSFLQLADANVAAERLDGHDIIRHVASGRDDYERNLFWRGKRGDRTWSAVRSGDRKYIRKVEGEERNEWMFDLSKDQTESSSLLPDDHSADLRKLLADWEIDVKSTR
jgi:arylsulfatase A